MENLCKAINELTTESSDSAGAKAAELARKSKEIFEKKTGDIEAFLLHCSPSVGSAAMIAAIKALFDTSAHKNNEQGCDRAVELLKHYLDGGLLVPEHLRLVPEIFFPLARNIGKYCQERKKKPEIGEEIVEKALRSVLSDSENKNWITSAHCILFSCALKTGNYEKVLDLIPQYINGVYDENPSGQPLEELAQGSDNQATSSSFVGNAANAIQSAFSRGKSSKHTSQLNTAIVQTSLISTAIPMRMEAKWVLMYFYYSGIILTKVKEYKRALVAFESALSMPALQASDYQTEAYKKHTLISLLVHGSVPRVLDRASVVVRAVKTVGPFYENLSNISFQRGENTASEVRTMGVQNSVQLQKDENMDLLDEVVLEMQKRSVLAVAKIYTSIQLPGITELAQLDNDETTKTIIKMLSDEKKLDVETEGDDLIVWRLSNKFYSLEEVENKYRLLEEMESQLLERNGWLASHPTSAKSGKATMSCFNEDEGLSMTTIGA